MSILFSLLALLLAGTASAVLITNLFAWYEAANRQPKLLENRITGGLALWVGRLLAVETFLLLLTLVLRPLGWQQSQSIRHREEIDATVRPPVLLLHGLFHNSGCWWWLRRRLRRRGFPVYTLNLPLWQRNLEPAINRVTRLVDQLRIARGVEKIHLVGHSMGGLVAMHYLRRGNAEKVDRCILLATPIRGSKMAALAVSPMGRALLPGSPMLAESTEASPLPDGRLCAIYSRHDNLVLPPENARLERGRNIELTGVQHTGLLYHPQAVAALIAELTEEEPCAPSKSTAASGWK